MTVKIVHVVYREGPEWQDPIEGYYKKGSAENRARELNKQKDNTDVFESLSGYVVKPLKIMDGP